jgi:uncharacterized membrane protein
MMKVVFFWLMPLFYIFAGINHFINPDFYLRLIPDWLPQHELSNDAGGGIEILLGIGWIPKRTRKISAWLIIAMLTVFFFVIHIPMVIQFYGKNTLWFRIAVVRLPLQVFLIWWAYKYTRRERITNATEMRITEQRE